MKNPFRRRLHRFPVPWDAAVLGNIGWANDRAGVELYEHTSALPGGEWGRWAGPNRKGARLMDALDRPTMGKHEGAEAVLIVFDRFNTTDAQGFLDWLTVAWEES